MMTEREQAQLQFARKAIVLAVRDLEDLAADIDEGASSDSVAGIEGVVLSLKRVLDFALVLEVPR